MNKTTKVLLLVIATFLSIGSILYFYKTIISPPDNLKFENKHIMEVESSISKFDKLKKDAPRDSLFYAIHDKTELYLKESYIRYTERDELMEKLVNKHLPLFVNSSFAKFSKSKWNEKDHKWMERIISELKSLKINNNSEVLVQGKFAQVLNSILEVTQQYKTAKNIASQTNFNNINDAQIKISNAKEHAEKEHLKNCISLVDKLNDVPIKIEKSHTSHLEKEVNKLWYFENYKEKDYQSLTNNVFNKIKEYKDFASIVYGFASDLSEIEKDAAKYYNEAQEYYKNLVKATDTTPEKKATDTTPENKVTTTSQHKAITSNEEIEVFNPEYRTISNNRSCKIVKVEVTSYITKVDFEYTNLDAYKGWCSIDPDTYIQITKGGKKYKLTFTDKIYRSPYKNEFSYKNEKLNFTLFFSSIPQNTSEFDLIEPGNSDWKFYSIKLK